jgi:hypothetical protein
MNTERHQDRQACHIRPPHACGLRDEIPAQGVQRDAHLIRLEEIMRTIVRHYIEQQSRPA